MNPLCIAAAAGFALVALAGCGGSSNDTAQPPAPSLAAPTNFTYEVQFRWTATPGATRYELHVDPDGPGPLPETKVPDNNGTGTGFNFQSNGTQAFTGSLYFYDGSVVAPDLVGRINATYRLRACDTKGCGAYTAPIVKEYSYEFPSGRVPIFHSQSKDGLTLAIGQPSGDANSAVFVFTRSSSAQPWQQHALLRSGNAWFGYGLALSDDGNTLAVGESIRPQDNLSPRGTRSYIYQRSGSTWNQQASLTPHDIPSACQQPCEMDLSTFALSADGNLLAELITLSSQTAAKYMKVVAIHARDGATWSQRALFDTGDRDTVLMTLARDGKTLAVNQGATYRDRSMPSFALVFAQQSNGIWSEQARIPVGIHYFLDVAAGAYSSMQLSDDGSTLAVMARDLPDDLSGRAIHAADLSCGPLVGEGSAHRYYMALFARSGATWQRQAAISRGYQSSTSWALARDGNTLLYGNELFTRNNGTWACP